MFKKFLNPCLRLARSPGPFRAARRLPLVVVCRVYEAWYLLTR
jgi:hypothetical protein